MIRASVCLNSLMVVHFNVKTRDIYGNRNVTTRSEFSLENIRFLGYWDIKEGVTLRTLIVWRIECIGGVHLDLANCNESWSPRQLMWNFMPSPHE